MITTRDGRTYAGNIANQNERSIVLRVVGQDAVVISKSDIQSIDNSELSMMPEGMLDDMSTSFCSYFKMSKFIYIFFHTVLQRSKSLRIACGF